MSRSAHHDALDVRRHRRELCAEACHCCAMGTAQGDLRRERHVRGRHLKCKPSDILSHVFFFMSAAPDPLTLLRRLQGAEDEPRRDFDQRSHVVAWRRVERDQEAHPRPLTSARSRIAKIKEGSRRRRSSTLTARSPASATTRLGDAQIAERAVNGGWANGSHARMAHLQRLCEAMSVHTSAPRNLLSAG